MKENLKVGIRFEGQIGTVEYDEAKKEFIVMHPVRSVKEAVTKYLNTARAFQIPESQQLDDYREDFKLPGESRMYAELALSSMDSRIGVWVLWGEFKGS